MGFLIKILIFFVKFLRTLIDNVSDIIYSLLYENWRSINLQRLQNPILKQSAVSLAKKIRSKEVTSEQVVKAFIDRIKAVNGVINAVVDDRFEEALEDAKKVDEIIAQTEDIETLAKAKPFLGVPFTTKDCFAVEGLSFTAGLLKRKNVKADFDADAVQCLKKSGAIPLGVTNVSELCMWMESSNNVYGRTNNPYHIGRIPGGSSGGEGSILASGGSPFGIGSDVGGSIRMPAFFNGIFGHKPSTGIVSNHGQLPKAVGIIDTFLVTGPMSRFAEDLLPMMKVMIKPDLDLALDDPVDLRNVKVFYMPDDGGNPVVSDVHSELRRIQFEVIQKWKKEFGVGAELLNLPRMAYSTLLWSSKMSDEPNAPTFAQELTGLEGEISAPLELFKWLCKKSDHTLPALGLALFEKGIDREKSIHKRFVKMCDKLSAQLDEILGDNAILLYPSHSTPAPYHGQAIVKTFNFSYTAIFNVLGNPVTQVPLGLGTWGVPLGIQVVGGRNQDRLCLAVAQELERLFGGWVEPS